MHQKGSNQWARMVYYYQGCLFLVFGILIGIKSTCAIARSNEFQGSSAERGSSEYCDFSNQDRMYNISDLLQISSEHREICDEEKQCMEALASTAVAHSRKVRSPEYRGFSFPGSRRLQSYAPQNPSPYQYAQRLFVNNPSYYDRRPTEYYQGSSSSQGNQAGYYYGGSRYPYSPEPAFGSRGGPGAGLFNALSSISQYDDLKCVPRLLCEVATGVTPGTSDYKQSYDKGGGNSLISLLTALYIGESSPLISFGKSALTGYTNRGNPSVCYRDYPKCPRNNADLVNYLNNHNGGFFRFFGNNGGQGSQGEYYRGALRREPAPSPGFARPQTVRTGTGELKFDHTASLYNQDFAQSFFPDRKEQNESNKITFPQERLQEEQFINRLSKSLLGHEETVNGSPLYHQDRKDQEVNILLGSIPGVRDPQIQRYSRMSGSPKARLYFIDNPSNETTTIFTFPDGQKILINVGFSKLFSDSYKNLLRGSFANDHGLQLVDFEGSSIINLVDLYPFDRSRLDLQVLHPCDMICHDVKGTVVQFKQILLQSGSLSTLMAPEQPVLDVSVTIPCEVMCIDRRGERRQFSTTLKRVLRAGDERTNQLDPDLGGLRDYWENRDYQSHIRQQRTRNSQIFGKNARFQHPIKFSDDGNMRFDRQLPTSVRLSKSQSPKSHYAHKRLSNEKILTTNDNAYKPGGSVIMGSNPMAFLGRPIPIASMAEITQGSAPLIPGSSSGQPSLTIQQTQEGGFGIIHQVQDGGMGMIKSIGMPIMPMYAGFMPSIDSQVAAIGPINIPTATPITVCYSYKCSSYLQSPHRALAMCGGVLYFIPAGIILTLPICALILISGDENSAIDPRVPNYSDSDSGGLTGSVPDELDPNRVSPEGNRPGVMIPDGLNHDGEGFAGTDDIGQVPNTVAPGGQTVDEITPGRSVHEFDNIQHPESSTTAAQVPRVTVTPFPSEVIPLATTHRFRQPEGEDYPHWSCLAGETWNLDMSECVPIKYNKEIEVDYTHLSGSPWSGVTREPVKTHKIQKRKKLVIITDKGNITYIKAA